MTDQATALVDRVIRFPSDEEAGVVFENLYALFLMGERTLPGFQGVRSALRICDAFDAVSEEVLMTSGQIRRRLKPGQDAIRLKSGDFDLLRSVVKEQLLGAKERPLPARSAIKIVELLGIEE
jgi:predicted metalloprotease